MVENVDYCDTKLSLGAGAGGNRRKRPPALAISSSRPPRFEGWTSVQTPATLPEQQQLTIFYEGRVCVCDVTENQARTIICMAQREMERISCTSSSSPPTTLPVHLPPSPATPLPPQTPSLVHLPRSGSSMKRSLRNFLQNRRSRATSTSPHHQLPPPTPTN